MKVERDRTKRWLHHPKPTMCWNNISCEAWINLPSSSLGPYRDTELVDSLIIQFHVQCHTIHNLYTVEFYWIPDNTMLVECRQLIYGNLSLWYIDEGRAVHIHREGKERVTQTDTHTAGRRTDAQVTGRHIIDKMPERCLFTFWTDSRC